MPLSSGTLTARVWRVVDPLSPQFKELMGRNLPRHGFRPPDPKKASCNQWAGSTSASPWTVA